MTGHDTTLFKQFSSFTKNVAFQMPPTWQSMVMHYLGDVNEFLCSNMRNNNGSSCGSLLPDMIGFARGMASIWEMVFPTCGGEYDGGVKDGGEYDGGDTCANKVPGAPVCGGTMSGVVPMTGMTGTL